DATSYDKARIIIGMGININMTDAATKINTAFTSLANIADKLFDRSAILAKLINHLTIYIEKFSIYGFKHFKAEFEKQHLLNQKQINLLHLDKKISGVVNGINDQGHLLIKLASGNIKAFDVGDCSLVKPLKS
ncbi:MAG: hypothetical protein AAGG80_03765, partial [Pseudomonadota bacterium]